MANIATYKIQFKSDFVLTIHGDAGWTTPFCIKFWTGAPSQAYFVGWNGKEYINCKVDETDASRLIVLFDDHQLPVGQMKMQMAWHTTIADFPNARFDEVMNQMDVVATVEGEEKHVELAFEGETDPEVEYFLPAYAAEAQRQAAERERERVFTEQMQAAATATQCAENVDAELSGTVLTVTNRHGESKSVDTKGQDGIGVPSGGLTGQVLKKKSDSNYDTEWGEGGGVGNVESVNGRTGVVVLDANDVGALPANTEYQSPINDLEDIRSGAALGATAIQNVKSINFETITGTGNVLTTKVVQLNSASYDTIEGWFNRGLTDIAILYNGIVHRLTSSSRGTLIFEGIGYKNNSSINKKGISIITIAGNSKNNEFLYPQPEISNTNKLSSDLVNDSGKNNKFVTSAEKTTWNSKYTKPTNGIPVSDLADDARNHPYVDLGLPSGTLWATYNVGAHAETEYGNYYKYGKGATKYNSGDGIYTGPENPLAIGVDTARQVWGGNWHTPTKTQIEELIANTTTQWVSNFNGSGVSGRKFIATNGSGNYIFIPAAGFYYEGDFSGVGEGGMIYTSTPNDISTAYVLAFDDGSPEIAYTSRGYGISVRPVKDEPDVTKESIGLGNVTNDRQVKGLASGTTQGHVVTFGADGYTIQDSGVSLSEKQDALVSGTNIKTINNESILGSGNITIQGGGSAYVPTLNAAPTSSTTTYTKDGQTVDFEIGQFARVAKQGGGYDFYQLYDLVTESNVTTATWMMVEQVPDNVACISNDSGVGIVPEDGIRAESVTAGATMSVNADVVTVINGAVGTATITLQVPDDNLAHVWDILMTTDSSVAITFAMSNSATILYPNGFSVGASKAVEISVIGVGNTYYLRYGEFA